MTDDFADEDALYSKKSKTQVKREMHELLDLGKELVELKPQILDKIPLEPFLLEEILAAQKMMSHGARRRQIHYISQILRKIDALPIQAALASLNTAPQKLQMASQRWCERLITQESAFNDFLAEYPQCDRQQLHQLLRLAKQEAQQELPQKSAQEKLLKYLKGAMEN